MARGGGLSEEYVVRACVRDDALGASTVDGRLRAHVLRDIKRRQRADLSDNARAMGRLLVACEGAKLTLSSATQATVTVEADSLDYFAPVTRAVLDEAPAVQHQNLVRVDDGLEAMRDDDERRALELRRRP